MAEKNGIAIPRDLRGQAVQIVPAVTALKSTKNASISSSASITLQDGTTLLEVTANAGAVLCKWGATCSDATDGFTYLIPENVTRHIPVPAGQTDFHFIQKDSGAAIYVTEF